MQLDENEEKLLRAVALQNARAVLLAREKAERELLKTRDALRKAHERVNNILNSVTDGFVALDKEWRFTYINQRGEDIIRPVHKTRDQLLGRSHWEVFADTLGTPLEEAYRKAMREQVTVALENYYPPLKSWFDIRAYPSPDGLAIYFQDITPRKRAEEELSRQREWLQVTLSSIGDAVIATDKESRVTFLNPVAEALTGWSSSEAQGRPLLEVFTIINEQTRQPVEDPVRKVLAEGRIVGLANHTALVARDGKETAIEDSAAPIRDPAGNVAGAVMVFRDVTERRRAVNALRDSEERLRVIFNQAAVGIAVAALDGRFLQVNRKFTEILGYAAEELCAKRVLDLTHPVDQERTARQMRQLLAGEIDDYVYEKRFLRKGGAEVWCLTTVSVIRDEAGHPQRFVGVIEDITPRKQAEEDLRLTAERLQLALTAGGLGDWEWDSSTDVVRLSARAAVIFGLPEHEAITWTRMRELMHEEDREHARLALERALANRSDYHSEYRVRRPFGDIVWVAARGRGQYGPDGSIQGMNGLVADVSERKSAEEALRRSEEDLRTMADSIPQLAWMAEPDGHIYWYNRRWYEYTGATFEQMVGWGWQSVHDPTVLPAVLERWKVSLQTGRLFDMEFPLRGADGVFRWFLTRASPLRDASGRIVRWFGTNTDVDAVRRSQETVREERRILELLNETGHTIAANLDLRTLVQTVTDSATQLCGAKFGAFFYNVINEQGEALLLYTLSGAPREAFEKFGLPRNTPVFHPTFHGLGVVRSGDITQDPRYGQMAPHHGMPAGHLPVRSYLAVPVISRSGEVVGGLFFGHPEPDVFTERAERLVTGVAAQAAVAIDNARLYDAAQRELERRKRAEEALAAANAALDEKVRARTASLERAVAQMEEFSYSVSHDLRAPLRAMNAYARALLEDCANELSPTARSYVNRILRSSDRMDQLTRDVLIYSRLASADLPLSVVELDKLVHEIISHYTEFQPPAARVQVREPLLPVLAHEPSLGQCLTNLLSNAVKFVAPGVIPHITIRTELLTGAEGRSPQVRIWVEDNGIGIKPEHQDRLFRMFERLHRKGEYQGTGIGLAIVRKAMEKMSGQVGVFSDGRQGSQFWLQLPSAP